MIFLLLGGISMLSTMVGVVFDHHHLFINIYKKNCYCVVMHFCLLFKLGHFFSLIFEFF
jgi:hypothetical protein